MVSAEDIQQLGRYKTALVLVFSGLVKQLLAKVTMLSDSIRGAFESDTSDVDMKLLQAQPTLLREFAAIAECIVDLRDKERFDSAIAFFEKLQTLFNDQAGLLDESAAGDVMTFDKCQEFTKKFAAFMSLAGPTAAFSTTAEVLRARFADWSLSVPESLACCLDLMKEKFQTFAHQTKYQAVRAFKASLVNASTDFVNCRDEGVVATTSILPWSLKAGDADLKEICCRSAVAAAVSTLARFERDPTAQEKLQEVLQAWGPSHLMRELQVACKLADFQARLFKVLHAWITTQLAGCNPELSYRGALKTKEVDDVVGEYNIVHTDVQAGLKDLHHLLADLVDLTPTVIAGTDDGEEEIFIVLDNAQTQANAVMGALRGVITSRWLASLVAGVNAGLLKMPPGNWRAKAVEAMDMEYISKSVLGNKGHLIIAQLCEWVQQNMKVVEAVWKDSGMGNIADFNKGAWNKCELFVQDCKTVVGLGVVYSLLFNQATVAIPERARAAAEVRAAMLKNGIVLPEEISSRLTKFGNGEPVAAPALAL